MPSNRMPYMPHRVKVMPRPHGLQQLTVLAAGSSENLQRLMPTPNQQESAYCCRKLVVVTSIAQCSLNDMLPMRKDALSQQARGNASQSELDVPRYCNPFAEYLEARTGRQGARRYRLSVTGNSSVSKGAGPAQGLRHLASVHALPLQSAKQGDSNNRGSEATDGPQVSVKRCWQGLD